MRPDWYQLSRRLLKEGPQQHRIRTLEIRVLCRVRPPRRDIPRNGASLGCSLLLCRETRAWRLSSGAKCRRRFDSVAYVDLSWMRWCSLPVAGGGRAMPSLKLPLPWRPCCTVVKTCKFVDVAGPGRSRQSTRISRTRRSRCWGRTFLEKSLRKTFCTQCVLNIKHANPPNQNRTPQHN